MTFLELQNSYQTKYSKKIVNNLTILQRLIFHNSDLVKNSVDLISYRNHEIDFDVKKFHKQFHDYFFEFKPIEYIVKSAQFFNLEFYVNTNVLIPRMDTEIVLKKFIRAVKKNGDQKPQILDLCTGSGCLAIVLARLFQKGNIYGSDIDNKCLNVANKNKKNHHVNNLQFIQANFLDVLNEIETKIDYVICNPPYIDLKDPEIRDSVKKYEPKKALYAKKCGLDFYIKFAKYLIEKKWKPKVCCFEFGYNQKAEIKQIFAVLESDYRLAFFKDNNKIDRGVLLIRK